MVHIRIGLYSLVFWLSSGIAVSLLSTKLSHRIAFTRSPIHIASMKSQSARHATVVPTSSNGPNSAASFKFVGESAKVFVSGKIIILVAVCICILLFEVEDNLFHPMFV